MTCNVFVCLFEVTFRSIFYLCSWCAFPVFIQAVLTCAFADSGIRIGAKLEFDSHFMDVSKCFAVRVWKLFLHKVVLVKKTKIIINKWETFITFSLSGLFFILFLVRGNFVVRITMCIADTEFTIFFKEAFIQLVDIELNLKIILGYIFLSQSSLNESHLTLKGHSVAGAFISIPTKVLFTLTFTRCTYL